MDENGNAESSIQALKLGYQEFSIYLLSAEWPMTGACIHVDVYVLTESRSHSLSSRCPPRTNFRYGKNIHLFKFASYLEGLPIHE